MGNRIFTLVVLLLWATTMSWLAIARILPPFFQGEPPGASTLERKEVVCWQILCQQDEVGQAVSQVVPGADGTTEIHSRILLEDIPLKEMAPQWMAAIVDNVGPIKLDIRNRITLDSLDNLSMFETRVWLNDLPAVVKMLGRVQDTDLRVKIQSGEISHAVSFPAPNKSMLGGELTPDAKMPAMFSGRRWQKEVYSPFRAPHRSVELLQAEVFADEPVLIDGKLEQAKRVEYHTLSSTGVSAKDTLRAELWVVADGTVIRQDLHMMNVTLRFNRKRDAGSKIQAVKFLDLESVATTINPTL